MSSSAPTNNSSRPYLLRAIYEWLLDNNLTPYILLNTATPGVDVPDLPTENNQLVLNIDPEASRNLLLGNQMISFSARFGGVSRNLSFPIAAVMAIYARENGLGMAFGQEPVALAAEQSVDPSQAPKAESTSGTKPNEQAQRPKAAHLSLVK